jgi:acyl-coenzyme A synthetase/AMP-(fatty) acid ligase
MIIYEQKEISINVLFLFRFSVNCLDRHLETRADKVALIWEKDEPGQEEYITYK